MTDGITFNIGCTKYDIHDNDVVNIYKGKAPETKQHVVPECEAQEIVTADAQEITEESAQETIEEAVSDDISDRPLPECLSTPAAKRIWHRLQTAALIDDHYQPVGLFRWQSILLANAMAEKLDISRKWKTFESLWGMSSMRQGLQTAMKNAGAAEFYKKLKAVGV